MTTYFPLRDVTQKTRTTVMGEAQTFNLSVDIEKQSLDDVHQMMRNITANEIVDQQKLRNPYSRAIFDGSESKSLADTTRRTEVQFGAKVPRQAMIDVSKYLLEAIRKSTGIRTGALRDLDYWDWVLVRKGKVDKTIMSPTDIPDFNQGDALILRPKLAYSTVVNNLVSKHGTVAWKSKRGTLSMGFLGWAAQKAKRNPQYKTSLTIYAARDPNYKKSVINYPRRPQVEQSSQGTGFIVIRAARPKRYRKLF